MRCVIWWTTPLDDLAGYGPLLDRADQNRLGFLRREMDRRRFATGRILTRLMAGAFLGVPPREVGLAVECTTCGSGRHGKPKLTHGGGIDFSITHSGDRVGVAMAECGVVGVDVEEESGVKEPNPLEPYVLTQQERAGLESTAASARTAAFLRYWTRKEAILKASGSGLTTPMTECVVSRPDEAARILSVPGFPPGGWTLRLVDLAPGPGYIGAVAVAAPGEVEVSEHFRSQTDLLAGARA